MGFAIGSRKAVVCGKYAFNCLQAYKWNKIRGKRVIILLKLIQ